MTQWTNCAKTSVTVNHLCVNFCGIYIVSSSFIGATMYFCYFLLMEKGGHFNLTLVQYDSVWFEIAWHIVHLFWDDSFIKIPNIPGFFVWFYFILLFCSFIRTINFFPYMSEEDGLIVRLRKPIKFVVHISVDGHFYWILLHFYIQ